MRLTGSWVGSAAVRASSWMGNGKTAGTLWRNGSVDASGSRANVLNLLSCLIGPRPLRMLGTVRGRGWKFVVAS